MVARKKGCLKKKRGAKSCWQLFIHPLHITVSCQSKFTVINIFCFFFTLSSCFCTFFAKVPRVPHCLIIRNVSFRQLHFGSNLTAASGFGATPMDHWYVFLLSRSCIFFLYLHQTQLVIWFFNLIIHFNFILLFFLLQISLLYFFTYFFIIINMHIVSIFIHIASK